MLAREDRAGDGPHRAGAGLTARRSVPAVVGAAAFVLHAATACRTVFFGDSGELVTAAAGLGVAHPPGYPLWTLLAKGALALPAGEPAFRVALLSGAACALACALAALWVLRATDSVAAALGAGLLLATTDVVWAAATDAEVYTAHLLAVLALLEAARRSAPVAAGAILGLGLAHHPTIVLALPSAAILAWPGRRTWSGRALAGAAVLALAIPAAAYASLLPRALAHPEASWGTLRSLADVAAHASAQLYRPYDLGWAGALRADPWKELARALVRGTGGLGAALALAGLVRGPRREVAALAALAAASCAFAVRYGVEDVDAYLIPAAGAIAILAGFGLAVPRGAARGPRLAASALAAAAVALALARNLPHRDLRAITAAADYGRDMLDTLPSGAALIADGDDAFALAYLQRVLGERADVAIYDSDGFVLRDVLEEPGFPAAPGEPEGSWRSRRLAALAAASTARGSSRPVYLMSLPEFPLPETIRIDACGILYRASPAGAPPPDDAALWPRYREARIVEQARRVDLPFAFSVAGMYPLMRADRARQRGDTAAAIASVEEAVGRAPRSEAVRNTAGTVYGRMGMYDRAAREFEAAVAVKPASQRAWANLATARELAGDRAGAQAARERLARLQGR